MPMPPRPRLQTNRVAVVALALTLAAPADAAEKSLARYVARDDLLVYAEFSGLDAHADAWRKTSTYKLLNETSAGSMLRDVFSQVFEAGLATAPPGPRPTGKALVAAFERFARSGFVLGVNGQITPPQPGKPGEMPFQVVIAVRDAGGAELGKGTRQTLDLLHKAAGKSERTTREDGRVVTTITPPPNQGPPMAWWFEGDDLVIAFPGTEASVEKVVETATGKRPSAVDAPIHVELAKTAGNFEPVFVSYADLSKLPPLPPTLGLAGIKRIDSRWGFHGEQLMSVTRVQAPSPRKGLLALMDQPTFVNATNALPIPPGIREFSIISVDPGKLFDQIVTIAKETDPNTDAIVKQFLGMAQASLGVPLREELLAQIGPKMAFYIEPELKPIPITPYQSFIDWGLHPPKLTAVVEIRDTTKFARTLDTLADVANRQLKAARANAPEGTDIQLRPLKGAEKGYVLDVPLGAFPLPSEVRPTLMLGKGYLAFAVSPQAARIALSFETNGKRDQPGGEAAKNLVALNVNDPRSFVPDLIANIPFLIPAFSMVGANGPRGPVATGGLRLKIDADSIPTAEALAKYMSPGSIEVAVNDQGIEITTRDSVPSINPISAGPMAVALILPAVTAARDAPKRSQSVNNLKQIMLAMHNYHSAMNTFPPAGISDAEGKPLLSWRVAILPYIDQADLYKEFHLDEPWDSEHNKKLIPRIPAIYKSTRNQPADPNATFTQVFTGNGALFDTKGKGVGIAEVTDGTSNTIAVVEAGTAVIWSKPEDIPFDPEKDLPKFGGPGFSGGFNAGFADGSVKFLKNSIDPITLKALITRAGGEVISSDSF
jgi:prepilin-type processing-associated H-X9-DG protein